MTEPTQRAEQSILPLVAHIVNRFDYGGLENGLVNIINGMGDEVARHVIISLTTSGDIVRRITKSGVSVHCLDKNPGKDIGAYVRLYKLLRTLNPNIVHTRNYGTIDCQLIAFLAGVPIRIHGEHGWDVHDPYGNIKKYRYLRKAMSPLVDKFIVLSIELEDWLTNTVGIPIAKIERICNGVDVHRFQPLGKAVKRKDEIIFGSVTRFSEIKDPLNTIRSFVRLSAANPSCKPTVRLVMVGDGPLMNAAKQLVSETGMEGKISLVGSQLDVSQWLDKMDVFVMGSKREGISNTILEAMAAGLPVVATNIGGNPELVDSGSTGVVVPVESTEDLARAMQQYVDDIELIERHGKAARKRVETFFSLDNMVEKYSHIYNPTYSFRGRFA